MTESQDSVAKSIIDEIVDLTGSARAARLDLRCAGNPNLRRRIERLLACMETEDGFLCSPSLEVSLTARRGGGEAPGTRIGPYKLLQLLGEGGFGSVYVADQTEPVRRRVALKIIKPGMDSRQVLARFEAERQALALMDHPNIARVFDAGCTETGRPYMVMELVRGVPVTNYCDQEQLSLAQRIELFRDICNAVQHAHQKGIIHRDLKPSNVLVTVSDGKPLPKVIDFGIAKATAAPLTDKTVYTELHQLIGTPEYMSPEQADVSALDIDTRSDVYALGVLFYELLTGTTPFDGRRLRSVPFAEIQRVIRSEEPPRPSARLATAGKSSIFRPFGAPQAAMTDSKASSVIEIARCRRSEPILLTRVLRGDLDWIALKCLEKDRTRRYQSVGALAEDISRYLAGDAVIAAPPSAAYRLRKFVHRNRASVTAGAFVAAALLLGVIGISIALVHAHHQRDKAFAAEDLANQRYDQAERARIDADDARQEAEKANRVANAVTQFFTHDVLNVTPTPAGMPEPTVRQLLDAVPAKIDKYFKSDPAVEGIIRERVGQLYRRLGEIERSREYLEAAVPLLEQGLGPDHKQTLSAIHRLGELHMDLEQYDKAADLFDKAYQGRLHAHGLQYSLTTNSLARRGSARIADGRSEEGFKDMHDALAHFQKAEGPESRNAVVVARTLCDEYLRAGRGQEAHDLARELLEIVLEKKEALGAFEWAIRGLLGGACRQLDRLDESIAELDMAVQIAEQVYPPDHPEFVNLRLSRGRTLAALQRTAEARADLEAALRISNATLGPDTKTSGEIAAVLATLDRDR